jgi:hypothetical protein
MSFFGLYPWVHVFYGPMMTHKYRGPIVVFSISKNVDPTEEQKVLTSSFGEGFTVDAHRQIFRGF